MDGRLASCCSPPPCITSLVACIGQAGGRAGTVHNTHTSTRRPQRAVLLSCPQNFRRPAACIAVRPSSHPYAAFGAHARMPYACPAHAQGTGPALLGRRPTAAADVPTGACACVWPAGMICVMIGHAWPGVNQPRTIPTPQPPLQPRNHHLSIYVLSCCSCTPEPGASSQPPLPRFMHTIPLVNQHERGSRSPPCACAPLMGLLPRASAPPPPPTRRLVPLAVNTASYRNVLRGVLYRRSSTSCTRCSRTRRWPGGTAWG